MTNDFPEDTFARSGLLDEIIRRLSDPSPIHIALIGSPGAGKTTFMRVLEAHLARQQEFVVTVHAAAIDSSNRLTSYVTRRVTSQLEGSRYAPIPPQLREIVDSLGSSQRSDVPESLSRLFRLVEDVVAPRWPFLLIDALDESRDEDRLALTLNRFIRIHKGTLRLVVTSRRPLESLGLPPAQLATFQLAPLDFASAREVLRKRLVGSRFPDTKADSILASFPRHPLLLAVLAELVQSGAIADPENVTTASLYDVYINHATHMASSTRFLLAAIAVLEPISPHALSALCACTLTELTSQLRPLEVQGMLSMGDQVIRFAHKSFLDHLRADPLGGTLDVARLEFGSASAETDPLLRITQHSDVASVGSLLPLLRDRPRPLAARSQPSDHLSDVVSGRTTIVLGDRGTGKSALFLAMTSANSVALNATPTVPNTPIFALAQQPSIFLQQMRADNSTSSAERFRALWLLYAASLAAREIQLRVRPDTAHSRRYLKDARRLLRFVGWGEAIRNEGRISWWLASARRLLPHQVTLAVGPVEITPQWAGQTTKRTGADIQVVRFLEDTDACLVTIGQRLLIAFDQVDEAYKYERDVQEALVQGLLLAESWLSQTKAIRLLALLRTDLFESYDIQERNKFVSRMVRLEWQWADIVDELLERAYSNAALSHVRDWLDSGAPQPQLRRELALRILFPSHVEGIPVLQWLYEGLKNAHDRVTPRQIVLFLNVLRSRALRPCTAVPIFSEGDVSDAMTELSELSYQEVLNDFRVATVLIRNCRAGGIRQFGIDDVKTLIDEGEGTAALQCERLERLGVLDRLVVEEADRLVPRFRLPVLYTRCWKNV